MSAETSICGRGDHCPKESIFTEIQNSHPGFIRQSCDTALQQAAQSGLPVDTNCGIDALYVLLSAIEGTQPPQENN